MIHSVMKDNNIFYRVESIWGCLFQSVELKKLLMLWLLKAREIVQLCTLTPWLTLLWVLGKNCVKQISC